MFGQFLSNTNEILQCAAVLHSKSGDADSGQLNKALGRNQHATKQGLGKKPARIRRCQELIRSAAGVQTDGRRIMDGQDSC
jgi:hypothetical protein